MLSLQGKNCGVCGGPADFFFVHGYRCRRHQSEKEPSDAIITPEMILVIPGLHKKGSGPFEAEEIFTVHNGV